MTLRCLLCDAVDLRPCFGFPGVGSVTSDCRAWPDPPSARTCSRCGHLQKPDVAPRLASIYLGYHLYRLSGGDEQAIFQGPASTPAPRSAVLAERLAPFLPAGSLRVLDVGCGNGATLRAFGSRHPDWKLWGFELDDKTRDAVMSIPGVRGFSSGTLEALEGPFDLISMVHVFEHVTAPGNLLDLLRGRLAPGGILLIEVPNILESPFDLAVIDHCSHFTPDLLIGFAESRGYRALLGATDWLPKEITCLLRPDDRKACPWPPLTPPDLRGVREQADWLALAVRHAKAVACASNRFGLFGTALAGTWLGSILRDRVSFFVDDDPTRVGKLHLDRPVILPADVDPSATVYLAFPPKVAERLRARLSGTRPGRYVAPPELGRLSREPA